ncbi:MAG: hypothetical protein N3F67_05525 [Acidilobaceae archaeon]|nr:hypothetical protein [Acidilobaceae archaeon]
MERKKTRGKKRKEEEEEIREVIRKIAEGLVKRLDMEGLVRAEELKELVETVVYDMVERGRKVEEEAVIRKLEERKEHVYKYVASKLIAGERELDFKLAEFLIYRVPELAGKAAPRLYPEAKKDPGLLSTLKSLWERHGIPLPLPCPRCGFRSLTPDLSCVICGAAPSEEEVKRYMNFEEELRRAALRWHESLIAEALNAGYVYYDGEVKPPSMGRGGAVIHLNRKEKALLRELLRK